MNLVEALSELVDVASLGWRLEVGPQGYRSYFEESIVQCEVGRIAVQATNIDLADLACLVPSSWPPLQEVAAEHGCRFDYEELMKSGLEVLSELLHAAESKYYPSGAIVASGPWGARARDLSVMRHPPTKPYVAGEELYYLCSAREDEDEIESTIRETRSFLVLVFATSRALDSMSQRLSGEDVHSLGQHVTLAACSAFDEDGWIIAGSYDMLKAGRTGVAKRE